MAKNTFSLRLLNPVQIGYIYFRKVWGWYYISFFFKVKTGNVNVAFKNILFLPLMWFWWPGQRWSEAHCCFQNKAAGISVEKCVQMDWTSGSGHCAKGSRVSRQPSTWHSHAFNMLTWAGPCDNKVAPRGDGSVDFWANSELLANKLELRSQPENCNAFRETIKWFLNCLLISSQQLLEFSP